MTEGSDPRPTAALSLVDACVAVALYVGTFALLARIASGLGLAEGEAPALTKLLSAGTPFLRWTSVDRLTALRLSVVSVTALLPVATFFLLRTALSWPIAAAGAALSLLAPRASVELVALNGDGRAAAWIAVAVAATVWASRGTSRRALSIAAAAALGLALSHTLAALVVLPVLMLDHAFAHRGEVARLGPKGLLPVPLSVALVPIVGAAVFVLSDRQLVAHPFERLREVLVIAGSPEIARATWAGEAPMPDTIPRFHAAAMLLLALPSLTSTLALTGALSMTAEGRHARVLVVSTIAVVALVGYPLVVPPALGRFPGRFALALPFAAVLATFGALQVGRALLRWRAEAWAPLGFACVLALASFVPTASTLSACFPLIAGGATRARHAATVPYTDGTEVGGLLASIDALGLEEATVFAPNVSPDAWELYRRLGRLRTRLRPVGSRPHARLSIDDGRGTSPTQKPTATLRRDGAVVAALYVHSPAL